MPVGPLEILILIAIALIVFGGKRLPQLGRRAGSLLRGAGDEAKEFKASVSGEPQEPEDEEPEDSFGRSAGRGLREFREALSHDEDPDGELVEGKVVEKGKRP